MEYTICMAVTRENTSSSISLLNFALADVVTYSPPFFVACNSLAMRSFSAIKNQTLKLVDLTYALVASSNAARFLHTSNTITCFSNDVRDT